MLGYVDDVFIIVRNKEALKEITKRLKETTHKM